MRLATLESSAVAPFDETDTEGLSKENVARIQQIHGYPAVSILLSVGPTATTTRVRLAQLVQTATARLLSEFSRPDVQPLLDTLSDMAAHVDPGPGDEGMALFANRYLVATVVLPFPVRDRVVIDETFATRDLVHTLLRSPHFDVLVLGGDTTRLHRGVGTALTAATDCAFPLLARSETGNSQTRLGTERSDIRDIGLQRHLRAVDDALDDALDANTPLFVVGAERRLALFRKRSRHRVRITETLSGVFERRSKTALREAIWPLLTHELVRRRNDAMAELVEATGSNRCAFGIDLAWRYANEGRCSLAVVEENFTFAARIAPDTNRLVFAQDIEHPDVIDDIADEIIEIVLAKGGRVAIVPDGTLPGPGNIAMALRH